MRGGSGFFNRFKKQERPPEQPKAQTPPPVYDEPDEQPQAVPQVLEMPVEELKSKLERGEQPARKRAAGHGKPAAHGRPHVRRSQQVALTGDDVARHVPGEGNAAGPGVRSHAAMGIDDRHLARGRRAIGGDELRERFGRGHARLQEPECARAVGDLDVRLGGDRAHPGRCPGHQRTHREPVRLHGDAEFACIKVPRDDGVGHGRDPICQAWRVPTGEDSIAVLGPGGVGGFVAAALAVLAALYFWTGVSRVLLFWAAFILTRPLGATLGDFFDKPIREGGLAFSRPIASAIIAAFIIACILFLSQRPGL